MFLWHLLGEVLHDIQFVLLDLAGVRWCFCDKVHNCCMFLVFGDLLLECMVGICCRTQLAYPSVCRLCMGMLYLYASILCNVSADHHCFSRFKILSPCSQKPLSFPEFIPDFINRFNGQDEVIGIQQVT